MTAGAWISESEYILQLLFLKKLRDQGFFNKSEFEEARKLLIQKHNPPISRLSIDIEK